MLFEGSGDCVCEREEWLAHTSLSEVSNALYGHFSGRDLPLFNALHSNVRLHLLPSTRLFLYPLAHVSNNY